jgi:hypothetical protein
VSMEGGDSHASCTHFAPAPAPVTQARLRVSTLSCLVTATKETAWQAVSRSVRLRGRPQEGISAIRCECDCAPRW